jgi:hypothetical protein
MRRLGKLARFNSRTSTKRPDSDKGAAAIIVAVLMVAVLGCAAMAVDVGAMYAEKAQLQNGADSSALAVGRDCANGNCGNFMATGSGLANSNANDSSSGVSDITFPDSNTVQVETNAREAGTGANHFSLFFARVMGIENSEINAVAEASWGPPRAGSTLPWTVGECVFRKQLSPSQLSELNSTGDFTGDPSSTHILLRYDENAPVVPGCAAENGLRPGGFGWLETSDGCSTDIDLNSAVNGQTGNHFPNDHACDSVLATIMDKPALIPLFDSNSGNGNNTVYSLIGFGAFQVTGYKFGGPSVTQLDPAAPSCTGNCRGLQGFFARFVSLGEYSLSNGTVPNYGGTVVALTE